MSPLRGKSTSPRIRAFRSFVTPVVGGVATFSTACYSGHGASMPRACHQGFAVACYVMQCHQVILLPPVAVPPHPWLPSRASFSSRVSRFSGVRCRVGPPPRHAHGFLPPHAAGGIPRFARKPRGFSAVLARCGDPGIEGYKALLAYHATLAGLARRARPSRWRASCGDQRRRVRARAAYAAVARAIDDDDARQLARATMIFTHIIFVGKSFTHKGLNETK